MNAHPAGPRHADEIHHPGAPAKPQTPDEILLLAPNVWPRNLVRGDDGVVSIAGVAVTELAAEYGTPLFVIDEDDFRSRCRDIAAAFGGGDHVHYAAKAFLCSEIARWVNEEGLSLDVATGESSPSRCMRTSRLSESRCTATTSPSPSSPPQSRSGSAMWWSIP